MIIITSLIILRDEVRYSKKYFSKQNKNNIKTFARNQATDQHQ